jgi:hypothetical protein
MAQFLHIRVAKVEILHSNGIEESYFSVTHREKQYFSSVFTRENMEISDDMLIGKPCLEFDSSALGELHDRLQLRPRRQ